MKYSPPHRKKRKKSDITAFVKENADVGKEFAEGKLNKGRQKAEDLTPDERGLVNWKGKKAGDYKDEQGRTFLVETKCTHMGCGVKWNDTERSWDCPCHGSPFEYNGKVIEGPATTPLKLINKSNREEF
ncbi:Rieske 2Fe-2S domain-containing protein [Alteribacillus bidgolensis]|uniref:Rieske [2Fe-2S] domain-containing protein n=1 Tax=Alteribacillus bidgolensis TaxID=930129 RepID=A0A1G8QD75_9BACI|nr:Rieske 2Fe-2S domain-containing protein [Alteribacillus bidgolensis]SDJ02395.1 Rieske [2Fe-2S] domain-containing protein [Alteribacillus bidgolensis]